MKIISVYDLEFNAYGKIVPGYDVKELLDTLDHAAACPESGTAYTPEIPELMALPAAKKLSDHLYGGMPIQLGCCRGRNTRLNCLEYHRDSEVNLGTQDFILLLGKREDIGEDGIYDTSKVRAFRVPAGVMIEVYATTLHFAPCSAADGQEFKVLIVLPKGTNTPLPDGFMPETLEDRFLAARNKWLLAHPESEKAKSGAAVGLKGVNIDISHIISKSNN